MTQCRLKRCFPIVLGAGGLAAALAAVPANAPGRAPSGSHWPGYLPSLLASASFLALVALVWQIFRARRPRRGQAAGEDRTDRVACTQSLRPVAGPLLHSVPACGRRVLIVDDNPINQLVALRAVTRLGYQAELAPGGEEALAAFARDRFDAVLMDCHMPGMDGYQAAVAMRRMETLEPAAKATPIIAMTASVIERDQQRCVAAGMDDYLSKPIRLAPLARSLKRWTAAAAHSPRAPTHEHGPAVADSLVS